MQTAAHDGDAKGDPRWSRILIVEGVSGIGKSTLIDALLRKYVDERPARKLRTLLHLTQAHTYGPLAVDEDRETLTPEQNVAHLDAVVSLLEWYVQSLTAERVPKFFAIVDTLHITHCHRPGVVRWNHVAEMDRRLAALGSKMVFLEANPKTLWDRGIWPRRDQEFITDYASRKWGTSLEAIHRHFVDEQTAIRTELARTQIEYRTLVVDEPLPTYLDEAYKFWLS